MNTDHLLYDVGNSTARVVFNRPEARNAMTLDMYEALYDACERVDADGRARVMLLRGAGRQAFVAGTDIREFVEFATGEDGISHEKRVERVIRRLESVRVPTIAVVDGYALGGGMAIAAVCDLRICSEQAKFGIPIARTLGNCLSMENYARLVGLVGPARTKEMIYTARSLSAEEAHAIGLATEVVPAEDLDARVDELCRTLTKHAPITLRVTKEAIRRLQSDSLDGDDLVSEAYGSKDFREGVTAFLEKRAPQWRGR
jgi:enoyl-CoA hydratase/carnithine racemase